MGDGTAECTLVLAFYNACMLHREIRPHQSQSLEAYDRFRLSKSTCSLRLCLDHCYRKTTHCPQMDTHTISKLQHKAHIASR